MNPRILKIYQDAYNQQLQEKYDDINYSGWIAGQYMICAIQNVLEPKKAKYPEEPFLNQAKSDVEAERSDVAAIRFEEYIDVFNKQFKKKQSG